MGPLVSQLDFSLLSGEGRGRHSVSQVDTTDSTNTAPGAGEVTGEAVATGE